MKLSDEQIKNIERFLGEPGVSCELNIEKNGGLRMMGTTRLNGDIYLPFPIQVGKAGETAAIRVQIASGETPSFKVVGEWSVQGHYCLIGLRGYTD